MRALSTIILRQVATLHICINVIADAMAHYVFPSSLFFVLPTLSIECVSLAIVASYV